MNLSENLLRGFGLAAVGCGLALAGCTGDDPTATPGETPEVTDPPATATQAPATDAPTATATAEPTPTATATAVPVVPAISIIAPARDNQDRPLGTDADLTVAVTVAVTGFDLADPNGDSETGCDGAENCGHYHVFIDDTDGNQDGAPYNNLGWDAQAEALYAYLDGDPTGTHTVTVQLVNDDHSPVLVDGESVEASRIINTTVAVPSIAFISPQDGATVIPVNNANLTAAVTFAAPNVTLAETVDDCGDVQFCGQVRGSIDNVENVVTFTNAASFSYAGLTDGDYTLKLEVIDFDGNVMMFDDPSDGADPPAPIMAEIGITLELPQATVIAAEVEGSRVRLGTSAEGVSPINFTLNNVILGTPETCADSPIQCGQLWAKIDGDDCNEDGMDYNVMLTDTTANQIVARFGYCDEPFGEHTVTLSVRDSSGNILTSLGDEITDDVTVFAIDQNDPDLILRTPITNQTISVEGGEGTMNVTWSVEKFAVAATEDCPEEGPCGYVDVYFGETKIGDKITAPGVQVDVGTSPRGEDDVTIHLFHHDGNPAVWASAGGLEVTDTATGVTIEDATTDGRQ